jgi:hypothetical protein
VDTLSNETLDSCKIWTTSLTSKLTHKSPQKSARLLPVHVQGDVHPSAFHSGLQPRFASPESCHSSPHHCPLLSLCFRYSIFWRPIACLIPGSLSKYICAFWNTSVLVNHISRWGIHLVCVEDHYRAQTSSFNMSGVR